jgi:hypothetical protein
MLTTRFGIRCLKLVLVSAWLLVLRAQESTESPQALILAAKLSKPADAIAQLEEVLKTQGDYPDALERAVQAHAQVGRRADAEAAWKRARRLPPDCARGAQAHPAALQTR